MLNLHIDDLRVLPRDERGRLRRASPYHPQPAGNSQNEQRARAALHARNEADLGDGRDGAANDSDPAPTDVGAKTHWTRVLHHDLFAADDVSGAQTVPAAAISCGVCARVRRLLDAAAAWIALR